MRLPTLPAIGDPCRRNGCSACCHDVEMLLTEEDRKRITEAVGNEDYWFRAPDGYWQLVVEDRPAATGMVGNPCVFLAPNGLCTIREVRPAGCRLYPAVYDGRATLDDEHCPHTAAFSLPRWAHREVRALAIKLVDERNRREGPGAD